MNSIIRNKIKFHKIKYILFWILLWEVAALFINNKVILPSPYDTIKILLILIPSKMFWITIISSILRVLLGFSLSCILGILIGLICGLNKTVFNLLNPLVITIKSTPVVSVIILILLWINKDITPVIVCLLLCFPIIWTNTVEGILNVDKKLLQMAKIYKVNTTLVLKDIYLKSIRPYISAGMLTALGLGWKVTVTAEVLSSSNNSIGKMIYNSKIYLETEELFAWTVVIIILSYFFEYMFTNIIRKKVG